MKRILVTGSKGYVGLPLVEKLKLNNNLEIVECDLKDNEDFENTTGEFDTIVHLAAFISVAESQEKSVEYLNNNILKSIKLINNTRCHNFIFISTNAIHKDSNTEDPESVYGMSKIIFEKILENSNMNYNIVRLANPIGLFNCHKKYLNQINAEKATVFFKLAECKKYNKTFNIHNNKNMVRDFIPLNYVIDGLYNLVINKLENGKYILGANNSFNVVESLINICEKYNINYNIIELPDGVSLGYIMESKETLKKLFNTESIKVDIEDIFENQYLKLICNS